MPGWTGEYEWTGTVPPDRLPAMLDPPSGAIVTANAEIDRHWPSMMTRDWDAPFRIERIVQLLGARTGLTQDDMRDMQMDVRAVAAERILAAVEAARKSPAFEKAEPEARLAIERLRLWDRQVDGRPVVALYEAFVRALWRRTFADEMEADGLRAVRRVRARRALHGHLPDHRQPDVALVERHRDARQGARRATTSCCWPAADAVIALEAKFGDESNWSWDRLHTLSFRHALGAGGALLNWAFSRGPVPMVGDSYTVRKASVDVRSPYNVVDISSYRQVIDVGNWDQSRAVNTTGQSGNT